MKAVRFWKMAGVTAALAIVTLGLLALNLMAQPPELVEGVSPVSSKAPIATGVPGSGTPEPSVVMHLAPKGSDDGTCASPLPIACGEQDSRSNSGYNSNHDAYSCIGWDESGPEVIYSFTLASGSSYTVTAQISNFSADLDVFLLASGGCNAGTCLADDSFHDDTAVARDVPPGTYYIAVDGYQGAMGSYTLDLTCDSVPLSNNPPNQPSNPDPADEATGVDLVTVLRWTGGDPDGDPVLYTIEGGPEGTAFTVWYQDISVTACQVGPLDPNTRYGWKVTAEDTKGGVREGPIWAFTTSNGNQPPNEPSSPSPKDGATGVSLYPDLSWTGGDPDIGDTLVYTIYGDLASSLTSDQWCTTTGRKPRCKPPELLQSNTKYAWQVVASDQKAVRQGTFWEFTTGARVYVPVITRKLETSAVLAPGTTPSPTPTATNTPTPTPTTPPTVLPPPSLQSVTRFVNRTPYVIVSLVLDGVEQYPATPLGLLPNTYVDMDLGVGNHTLDAYNGWWQGDGSRFTMYWWQTEFPQQAGAMTEINFEGPAVELLLPDFGPSQHWEGEYWTGEIVTLHYAGFCFYDDGSFRFYLDGVEADTGTYEELYRTPGLVTFRATNAAATESFDAVLNELDGSFTMGNGPADWRLIQYNPSALACPVAP
jgi:hypothetical protein